jgi:aspartyl-tRNA(Asn)/glutamyl-tRNA(Gln) amidotransferase subunit A
MSVLPSLADLDEQLHSRETSATALTETALARIGDPSGEGARAFVAVDPGKALAQAAAMDKLAEYRIRLSPLHGIPVSVKDLLDVQGEVTRAGSKILDGTPPATKDAVIVARLRSAGAVIIGRTNMTEFAYGGIGFNPHYGTPAAPYDRQTGRVPGGSSAGAAVSVADGMAHAAIGTDTGGSCRIPAAFCGVVGYKPSQPRVPRQGCFPLSDALDSIGPLARSVADCALIDAIIAGEAPRSPAGMPIAGLRLAIPANMVLEDLEAPVAKAFERAVGALSAAGAQVREVAFPVIDRMPELFVNGGIGGAEAFALHKRWLETRFGDYDPKVSARIEFARAQTFAEHVGLKALRAEMIATLNALTYPYDALMLPAVSIVPPPIALFGEHQSMADYTRINGMSLRNTYVGNAFDRCSISLPCHEPDAAPVGLMLIGEHGGDHALFRIAAAIERQLAAKIRPSGRARA